MADSINETTRAIAGKRVDRGKEFEAYQEAQNQLLAIQAEQKQNLASARAAEEASLAQTQTAGQAAELAGMMAAENANFNPATQNILNGYGLGQPKTVSTQGREVKKTPGNITINNNYYNTTTNYPIPGRELAFKQPQQGNGLNSFKAWLNSIFAKQNEEAGIRQREYERRERSLSRDANKMIRKMNEIGKGIGESLDPRRVADNSKNQLSTLLKLFGFYKLVENWNFILEKVDLIEEKITGFIGSKENGFKDGRLYEDIAFYLGGDQNKSLIDNLRAVFVGDGKRGGILQVAKEYFEGFFEERAEAINAVPPPEFGVQGMIKYIGEVIGAAFGGARATARQAARAVKQSATEADDASKRKAFWDTSQDHESANASGRIKTNDPKLNNPGGTDLGQANAILKNGEGRANFVDTSELDSRGNLTNVHGTITQGNAIAAQIGKARNGEEYNSSQVLVGLDRLRTYAAKNDGAVVNPDFIRSLGGQGQLAGIPVYYKLVAVPKDDADYARLGETLRKDAAISGWDEVKGNIGTAAAGGALVAPPGAKVTSATVAATTEALNLVGRQIASSTLNNYTLKLVPCEKDDETGIEYAPGKRVIELRKLSVDDIDSLVAGFTGSNAKVDLRSGAFATGMQNKMIKIGGSNKKDQFDVDTHYAALKTVQSIHDENAEELKQTWENSVPHQAAMNISKNINFNIDAAVRHINAHAEDEPTGYCARHVSNALQAAGFKRPNKHARDYPGWLQRNGFEVVSEDEQRRPGDIMTIDPHRYPDGYFSEYGHVAMWDGKRWVSDFVQKRKDGDVYAHHGEHTPKNKIRIWRYTGEKTSALIDISSQKTTSEAAGSGVSSPPDSISAVSTEDFQSDSASAPESYKPQESSLWYNYSASSPEASWHPSSWSGSTTSNVAASVNAVAEKLKESVQESVSSEQDAVEKTNETLTTYATVSTKFMEDMSTQVQTLVNNTKKFASTDKPSKN